MSALRTNPRRGFALMAALWIVVLVGATAYQLSARSHSARLAVANALEGVQAGAAADAGLETLRAELEQSLRRDAERRFARDAGFTLTTRAADTLTLGTARALASATDAASRLHLNRASDDDLRRLLVALDVDEGMADRLAQRIVDWRDADDFRRERGAERDDYARMNARTLPSNAPFVTVEELRSIDGMTAATLERIAHHVTVHGSGQVNVNTASGVVLATLPGFSAELVRATLRMREGGRTIGSIADLERGLSSRGRRELADAMPALESRVIFDIREILVESSGWVDGSPMRARVTAVLERSGESLLLVSSHRR